MLAVKKEADAGFILAIAWKVEKQSHTFEELASFLRYRGSGKTMTHEQLNACLN